MTMLPSNAANTGLKMLMGNKNNHMQACDKLKVLTYNKVMLNEITHLNKINVIQWNDVTMIAR